ncbi:hypothetical protein D3C81_2076010 [compost metagenome]
MGLRAQELPFDARRRNAFHEVTLEVEEDEQRRQNCQHRHCHNLIPGYRASSGINAHAQSKRYVVFLDAVDEDK